MSDPTREADLSTATACICANVDGTPHWQETRDNIVDALAAAREQVREELRGKIAEELYRYAVPVPTLKEVIDRYPHNSFAERAATALLAILRLLDPKEPT